MTTSATFCLSLETSVFVAGSSIIRGLASGFGAQRATGRTAETPVIFYLWGTSACLSLLAFLAARGLR